jgi:hypothetical protein
MLRVAEESPAVAVGRPRRILASRSHGAGIGHTDMADLFSALGLARSSSCPPAYVIKPLHFLHPRAERAKAHAPLSSPPPIGVIVE